MNTALPGSIAHTYETGGFGLNNLPYGSFDPGTGARPGVRIGDSVLDLPGTIAVHTGSSAELRSALTTPNLDGLLSSTESVWSELRETLLGMLSSPSTAADLESLVHPISGVRIGMPFTVFDYVDFYASENHARNTAQILRPGQPTLGANWKQLPIGYHGRAGTIVPSGTDVTRPKGIRIGGDGTPTFGPSERLDIEAEIGFVLGATAPTGEVALADAARHIFGVVLVNDWSARDIQMYEATPLGPFLGKSFATSISPWVVPLAALDAARIKPPHRDVPTVDYLDDSAADHWGFDIDLVVELDGAVISRPPFSTMYWTAAQMLSHMTVNGATIRAGDLFASGTVSGENRDQRGSFLELSWGGQEPLTLLDGASVTFLEDGHTVRITAAAPGPNGTSVSFGEVVGRVLPAS